MGYERTVTMGGVKINEIRVKLDGERTSRYGQS